MKLLLLLALVGFASACYVVENLARGGHFAQIGGKSKEECCQLCTNEPRCTSAHYTNSASLCSLQSPESYTSERVSANGISWIFPKGVEQNKVAAKGFLSAIIA
eukprot:TRINITY_DN2357_c0_g1_i2.p2 TRINITY_DN2357_c0_g1~~TRINITY_DN2357_c0_g1_i2.p2  ORF type:complete len:115 (+),score=5.85 TRINITY_DN2357_c0_g1_i2:35-346(+)